MPANTLPIFSKIGNITWNAAAVTAANTTKDGTSGTIYTVFTADATNGSRLERLRIKAMGTNVSTVMRIFINNGGVTTVAGNNILYDELTISSSYNSETSAQINYEIPMAIALPPGYTVFVTIGTAVSAGFAVTAVGGNY